MRVLIIEDELPSAKRLERMIRSLDTNIELLDIIQSVSRGIKFLTENHKIDLIFLDIQLEDGLGLEILDKTGTKVPIIFTTAYDEFAIEAFKHYSIDYLLKPIKENELHDAIGKYKSIYSRSSKNIDHLLDRFIKRNNNKIILAKRGRSKFPVPSNEIAYFYNEGRDSWLVKTDNTEYHLSKSLDQIEKELNSDHFMRINRKVLCSKSAIQKFEILSRSKILVSLQPKTEFEVQISAEKSQEFKQWLTN